MENLLETYNGIQECHYKNEHYTVRDNGAVLRHAPNNKRTRPTDNKWIFGKQNSSNGYMFIASVRIHQIVATAFHGEPPTKEYVVDHIDTNRANNRPENLRWVTRLENILKNPITVKRIESICDCKIEDFVSDPKKYRHLLSNAPTDIQWMGTVTFEQAEEYRKSLTNWAESDKALKGKSFSEIIYHRNQVYSEGRIEEIFRQVEKKSRISRQALCHNKAKRGDYYEARKYAAKLLRSELDLSEYEIGKLIGLSATTVNLYLEVDPDRYSGDYKEMQEKQFKRRFDTTPENYIQKNWGTQSEFPLCPQQVTDNPISDYAAQLRENEVLFQTMYYSAIILKSALLEKEEALLVLYEIIREEDRDKRWGMMKITFENEKFVHEIIRNYNGTQEHYWLIDTENHFNSLIEGTDWNPLYDSQGREFREGYMPL